MSIFNVALLQLSPLLDIEQNLHKGLLACEQAKKLGADLALFPELWQIGYAPERMLFANALSVHDEFIQKFRDKAVELGMAIAITYLGKGKAKPTNSVAIIDAKGEVILEYAKANICSFDGGTELLLEPGLAYCAADLTFGRGVVRLGAMICFDREFPESARALAALEPDIILVPNACAMHDDPILGDVRLAQLRGRAFENMVAIALTNYPAPKMHPEYGSNTKKIGDGHSCAVDVNGSMLVLQDKEEGIFLASFDLERIRQWQQEEVWGINTSLRQFC